MGAPKRPFESDELRFVALASATWLVGRNVLVAWASRSLVLDSNRFGKLKRGLLS
jgi:hypothetical protein